MKSSASHACAQVSVQGAFAQGTSVQGAFAQGMQDVVAQLPHSRLPPVMAVAYSGGADSSVLLNLAHAFAREHSIRLLAFHVHHGISPNADAWLAHCAATAQQFDIPFFFERVRLESAANLEARARSKRYAALGRLCQQHDVNLLLTAHHLDDQAETVLLRLLRGSLVSKGMETCKQAPGLLGVDQVHLARPLLGATRADILVHASRCNLAFVEDESNLDPNSAYARSALRVQVMPVLARQFPGYQQVLARSSLHAQQTALLLDELACQDWQQYRAPAPEGPQAGLFAGTGLLLTALHTLSEPRAHNLLRYWLASHGARLPSSSWLQELYVQLRTAREDAQVCVDHPDCEIHRYRQEVQIAPKWQPALQAARFVWQGEAQQDFPAFGGCLKWVAVASGEAGMDEQWLRQQTLELDYRQGSERIRLGPNRPHRSLKQHYQSLNIPGWQRPRLPLLFAAGSARQLLYAAGLGLASEFAGTGGARVRPEWQMFPS